MERLSQLAQDPRLSVLKELLPEPVEFPTPANQEGGVGSQAAVSLILRAGDELEVLLIRRAEAKGDPWSGHMALPGGRREEADPSLLQTAMRETLEEVNVDLAREGASLGSLQVLEPNTFRLPPISIFPFVFGVPIETEALVASPEVTEVHWAPLSYLQSPQASGTTEIQLGETSRTFPCFRVEGRVVWGLTYRVLQDFFRLIENHAAGLL
jgi:8-oxo-dGTP pyrophosphatase MutT (NUDIX family)